MKRGEIYYLDSVPPLHGGPLKDRRVLIITETSDIIMDNPIYVVVCCSTIYAEQKQNAVALPFHPRKGVAGTSFTKETWAVPEWVIEVKPSQLRDYQGQVPTDKLRQIAAKLQYPIEPSASVVDDA